MNQYGTCKLQAHRGVCTRAPENTMAAYKMAVDMGYDLVELDPKYTADGDLILFHDRTLDRTARLNGEKIVDTSIFSCSTDFVKKLDVGSWFDAKYAEEKVPFFRDALAFLVQNGMEIKVDNCAQNFPEEIQDKLFAVVAGLGGRIGITASDVVYLERAAKALPNAILHYDGIVDKSHMEYVKRIAEGHELYVWLRFDNKQTAWNSCLPATKEFVEYAKQFGHVGLWILTNDGEMRQAVAMGADVVETTGGITPQPE